MRVMLAAFGFLLLIAAARPASAADECGPVAAGVVVCTAADPAANGIEYLVPATVTVDGTTNGPVTIGAVGVPIVDYAIKVDAAGDASVVTLGTVDIANEGANNGGIYVNASAGTGVATVTVGAGSTISVTGSGGTGVWVTGLDNAQIDMAGTISTTGSGGPGVIAVGVANAAAIVTGDIATQGDTATGIFVVHIGAAGAATAILDGTVSTQGLGAYGVYATSVTGGNTNILLLDHGDVTTAGNASFGAFADSVAGGNATLATAGTITTTGDDAHGAWARVSAGTGDASVTNSGTVSTTGPRTGGLYARVELGATGNAQVNNSGTASVSGDESVGALVFSWGGNASLTNSGTIESSGATGNGVVLDTNGVARLTNTGNITATGAAASGIFVSDAQGGYALDIDAGSVNGGSLDLVLGTGAGISITDGNGGAVTVAGGASVGALSGWAIQDGDGAMVLTSRGTIVGNISGAGGNDRLLLDNGSAMNGIAYLGVDDDIATVRGSAGIAGVTTFDGEGGVDTLRFEGGSRAIGADILNWEVLDLVGADLTYNADLVLGGADTLTGTIAVDATSRLALPGNRRIAAFGPASLAQLNNAGLLVLASGGSVGNSLTIAGNYTGLGGVISLNTAVAGDGSASDRLVIDGGTASGDTRLSVANIGGSGALTLADGILVVDAQNGGTTTAGAFRLAQRVAAGAYEYQLLRGGASDGEDWFLRTMTDSSGIPLYRPEVALYGAIPDLARQLSLAGLPSLDERGGAPGGVDGHGSGAWGRLLGGQAHRQWSGGADVEADTVLGGLQAGFDVLAGAPYAGGHRDRAGLYLSLGHSTADISGTALGLTDVAVGDVTIGGRALGAYWTHFGPEGWYLDAVAQLDWFDIAANSAFDSSVRTDGFGYLASLEAGYPIALGNGWTLQPQAQLIWQGLSIGAARDNLSDITWSADGALSGVVGLRADYADPSGEMPWQPYAQAHLRQALAGTDGTRFDGSAPIKTGFGGTTLELGLGVNAKVAPATNIFAQADYGISLGGNSGGQAFKAVLGIEIGW